MTSSHDSIQSKCNSSLQSVDILSEANKVEGENNSKPTHKLSQVEYNKKWLKSKKTNVFVCSHYPESLAVRGAQRTSQRKTYALARAIIVSSEATTLIYLPCSEGGVHQSMI